MNARYRLAKHTVITMSIYLRASSLVPVINVRKAASEASCGVRRTQKKGQS